MQYQKQTNIFTNTFKHFTTMTAIVIIGAFAVMAAAAANGLHKNGNFDSCKNFSAEID